MISYFQINHYHSIIIFLFYWLLIFIIKSTYSQSIYQSLFTLSSPGHRFSPANIPAQFISAILVDSCRLCAAECDKNVLCRVFDYGAMQSNQCLLFEGNTETLGSIIPSGMPDSVVGTIQLTPSLFSGHGQACSSVCTESRYLLCSDNSVCGCMPHTYWDPSVGMCLAQMTIAGAPCDTSIMNVCRPDLNLTCSPIDQCVALGVTSSLVGGITIADRNTVIEGSSTIGFEFPVGIAVYDTNGEESLIVIDSFENQIVNLWHIDSYDKNVSVLASNWTGDDGLSSPSYLFLDISNQNDLYVVDSANDRIVLFSSMQISDPLPEVVAGTSRVGGSTLDKFVIPYGVTVDSQKNVYVSDYYNNRIMLWAENATSGILIAGTGSAGSDSMSLQSPVGLFLDEANSLLYVADKDNHRIQLFNLTGSPPYNGTTIAGGNGNGASSDQLYQPMDVWVSKKNGAVYIADSSNHRIQCWSPGATSGVTIAGDPAGTSGVDATTLSSPNALTINKNETRLYISDTGNGRIQQFDLH